MNYSVEEECFRHGINTCEIASDTALQAARSRLRQLESEPMTAYILTQNLHDFMLAMQHWTAKGYYVGDSSAIVCRADLQSAQVFKKLD